MISALNKNMMNINGSLRQIALNNNDSTHANHETGLNGKRKENSSHKRFESVRFQSPNSDLSSSDLQNCNTDESTKKTKEILEKGVTFKPDVKRMFLV